MASPSFLTSDRRRALGLGGLVAVAVLLLRPLLGLWGAMGTDAPLWGLTARDLWVGAPPLVPPVYPGLLAPLVAAGISPVAAGTGLSAASLGLLVALAHGLATRLGLDARTAAGVALAPLVLPDTVGWGLQLQPDASAAALAMGLAGSLVALHAPAPARSRWGPALATLALGSVAPALRAHGLVWAAVAALGLATRSGPTRGLVVLLPLGIWLVPCLLGVVPGLHPLDVPWADRAGGALAAFTSTDPTELAFLHELQRGERASYGALVTARDRIGQLVWHASRSLRLAPDGWVLIGLATVGTVVAHRRQPHRVAAIAPLAAALPAVLIWSQRRHVLLVAPIAIVVLAATLPKRRRWWLVAGTVLLVHGAVNWPRATAAWRSERPRAEHYAEVGRWLGTHAPPGSLLGGVHQDVGLYAPALPRHDPDGSPADWRTFLVTDRPPPSRSVGTWVRVYAGPQLGIWQLDPSRSPRPCADASVPPASPHLAVGRAHVDLLGCPDAP